MTYAIPITLSLYLAATRETPASLRCSNSDFARYYASVSASIDQSGGTDVRSVLKRVIVCTSCTYHTLNILFNRSCLHLTPAQAEFCHHAQHPANNPIQDSERRGCRKGNSRVQESGSQQQEGTQSTTQFRQSIDSACLRLFHIGWQTIHRLHERVQAI